MAARAFFFGLVALSGAGLAVQAAMNGRLRVASGSPVLAAVISFAVGLTVLCLVLQVSSFGQIAAQFAQVLGAPWWAFVGGMVGCVFVMLAAIGVGRIGPAATLTAAITGQIVGSLVIEHFGWLGVERHPVGPLRLLGVLLLLSGVFIVQFQPKTP